MPTLIHIPHDIVECVLDFLHDDKSSLLASSVVSKSWIVPCQTHLFNSLRIVGAPDNFESFLRFCSKNDRISRLIRLISVEGVATGIDTFSLHISSITEFLEVLPNLQGLVLCGLKVLSDEDRPTIFHDQFSLRSFTLDGCQLDNAFSLPRILRLFSEIKNLGLKNIYLSSFTIPTNDGHEIALDKQLSSIQLSPMPTKVLHFSIRSFSWEGGNVLEFLITSPSDYITDLQFIDITLSWGIMVASGRLLRTFGPCLISLRLDLRGCSLRMNFSVYWTSSIPGMLIIPCTQTDDDPEIRSFLRNITFCEKLETLTLGLLLDSDSPITLEYTWRSLVDILKALNPSVHTTLRELKVLWNIYGHDVTTQVFSQDGWNSLDNLLQSFQNLVKVEFCWEMAEFYWKWLEEEGTLNPAPFTIDTLVWGVGSETIKQMLPGTHARSLLVFSTTDPCS